jgi:hypothetical protein
MLGLKIAGKAFLAVWAFASVCGAQTTAKFEEWHARGTKENPSGVSASLVTRDGHKIYHASDDIIFQMLLASSSENVYTAELAGMGNGDEIVFQRSDAAEPSRQPYDHRVICCSDVRQSLGQKPTVVTTYFHLRLQPGAYSLFFQTLRVSHGWPERGHSGEGPVVTSDVLHITVLPDR